MRLCFLEVMVGENELSADWFLKWIGYRYQSGCFGWAVKAMIATVTNTIPFVNSQVATLTTHSPSGPVMIEEQSEQAALGIPTFINHLESIQFMKWPDDIPHAPKKIHSWQSILFGVAYFDWSGQLVHDPLTFVGQFEGVYAPEYLEETLNSLRETLIYRRAPTVSLVLQNMDHSVLLSYDSNSDRWIFADINQPPIQLIPGEESSRLVARIFRGFRCWRNVAFHTNIFALSSEHAYIASVIQTWQSETIWKKHHEIELSGCLLDDDHGVTRMHLAARHDDVPAMRDFLRFSMFQRHDKQHKAPIHYAVEGPTLECLRLLLDHGVSPNFSDSHDPLSFPPLFYALNARSMEAIEVLLGYRADPNFKPRCGMTPLDLARYQLKDGQLIARLTRSVAKDDGTGDLSEKTSESGRGFFRLRF